MKNTFFALALLMLAQLVCAQNKDTILIDAAKPTTGQTLTFMFKTDNPAFTNKKDVAGVLYTFNAKGNPTATEMLFKKTGDGFTASTALPDTALAFIVSVSDSALNSYKAIASVMYDAAQHPVTGAYKSMANVYSGFLEVVVGVKVDKSKTDIYQEMMYDAMKDTMTTFDDKANYYRYKKDTVQMIKLYTSLLDDKDASQNNFMQAVFYAGRIKQKSLSDTLLNAMKTKFPDGQWKKNEDYKKINAEKDIEKQMVMLQDFKTKYHEDAKLPNSMSANLQESIAMKYVTNGNFDAAVKNIPPSLKGANLAGLYNNIAWQFCLKDKNIKEAAALSKASLDTLNAIELSGAGKPPYLTKAKYLKSLQRTYATYEDTYAFLLYKDGDYKNAFAHEAAVLKAAPGDKSTISRYHLFMEKLEPADKVTASLASYIEKDLYDSAMEAQFKRLYKGKQPLDAYFAELTGKAQAVKTATFVKTMLNEPAANFSLVDLNGNKVSLESLKGKTVVIDFWATWCGPCKASFPAMKQIVNKYKDNNNVAVLFIDSWQTEDDKTKNATDYIKTTSYPFRVLLDNEDKVIASYAVNGIPTKFIIDKNGMVRFKTVGYNGNEKETVDEMSKMIELASKE